MSVPAPAGTEEQTWPTPLDIHGAAKYLGVNERYVRLLVAERRIVFLKVGRLLRFQTTDLDEYLNSCRVELPQLRRRRS